MKSIISQEKISQRLKILANEIEEYYQNEEFLALIVLNGAMFFGANLLMNIKKEIEVDSLAVSSYINLKSSGKLEFRALPKLAIKDKNILLIDDIFDTGFTLKEITKYLKENGAKSVESCVLLDKYEIPKQSEEPKWIGFKVENKYVVGYGLDAEEKYRNLPDIYVIE